MPILETTLTAGYAIPGWYGLALGANQAKAFGPSDLAELRRDAITVAVRDQELAGLDQVMGCDIGRPEGPFGILHWVSGLASRPQARLLGAAALDQLPRFEPTGDIVAPDGLGLVDDFQHLSRITASPVKVALPGPFHLSEHILPGGRYRTRMLVAEHLSYMLRQEMLRLVEAGCRAIELNESAIAWNPHQAVDAIKLLNETIHGIRASISVYLGFGSFSGRSNARRTYRPLFPALLEIAAETLCLEFAGREMAEADLWLEHDCDKRLAAGVIDPRNTSVETPEDVAARIRVLLRYVSEDKLVLTTDCDFGETARYIAAQKLASLVAGTRIVRQEITDLAEAPETAVET